MKTQIKRFGPSILVLACGMMALPHRAHTAPPAEPHPHIRAAINELREARAELERASHDFCGHRKDAVRDTQAALNQLQKALECDRK